MNILSSSLRIRAHLSRRTGKHLVGWHNLCNPVRHLFRVKNIDRRGSNGPLGTKRDQKSIFCFRIADFLSIGHITITPGATPKKFSNQKKISVSEVGVIFWGSSRILAISVQCPIAVISTLNFGPWSTKLGDTVRTTKKITHIDNGPGPG